MKDSSKTGTKPRNKKTRPNGLRMKELSALTGIPRSAILHYLAQGLLPKPIKTSPNMAYYDPACVERIEFIKAMQSKYAFPLSRIKTLLTHRENGLDVTPLIELSATVFGEADARTFSATELCRASGLKPGMVRKLIKSGLLLPLDNRFNQHDVAVCEVYSRCFALGADPDDLIFYAEAAQKIVDNEMHLRHEFAAHLPDDQNVELTQRMIAGARIIRSYVIDRTFQQRVAAIKDLKEAGLFTGEKNSTSGKK